jgi:hypothetical protein
MNSGFVSLYNVVRGVKLFTLPQITNNIAKKIPSPIIKCILFH